MQSEEKVYFGQLPLGNYEITAIGKTESEVLKSLRQTYNEIKSEDRPQDDRGKPRSFSGYVDYSGLYVHEMRYGKAEWL